MKSLLCDFPLRHYAPSRSVGREEAARLLIDNGANVNAADLDHGTPLVEILEVRLR